MSLAGVESEMSIGLERDPCSGSHSIVSSEEAKGPEYEIAKAQKGQSTQGRMHDTKALILNIVKI